MHMPIEYGMQDETHSSDWFTFRLISARSASNFGLFSSQLFFALPLEVSSFRSQAALRAARHLAVAFRMSLLSVTHSGANPLFPRTRNARSSAASAKLFAANISKEILERDVAKTLKSPCTKKISTESSNDACCCSNHHVTPGCSKHAMSRLPSTIDNKLHLLSVWRNLAALTYVRVLLVIQGLQEAQPIIRYSFQYFRNDEEVRLPIDISSLAETLMSDRTTFQLHIGE